METFEEADRRVSLALLGLAKRIPERGPVGAWLFCTLLMSLALAPSASAETVTYIHTDALGSVVAETDASDSGRSMAAESSTSAKRSSAFEMQER